MSANVCAYFRDCFLVCMFSFVRVCVRMSVLACVCADERACVCVCASVRV